MVGVLRIGLLGEVTAHIVDRPVPLGPARQRLVLAALAVDTGHVVSVDQLVMRVWGEGPPRRARGVLSSYVSRLRTALATDRFIWRSGGYVLDCDPSHVDLHCFWELHDRARAINDAAHAVALLTEARELWRGDALTGLDGPWADAERDRLHQHRLQAQLDLIDARLRAGEGDNLVGELLSSTGEHPLNEHIAAQFMQALYRAGRVADALDHYRRFRARLADELGTDPGAALQELQQRILHADPALAPTAQPLPRSAPLPHAPAPRQLPVGTAHFVGRTDYLDQLDAALDDHDDTRSPTVVISAIAGAGGVGKTALALHWAHRASWRYPDAQLYVNMRGYAATGSPMTAVDVLPMFLRGLGVAEPAIPLSVDEQSALYRSLLADRRTLILLDNAASADQVRNLLPGSSSCAVLVTSRDDLLGLTVSHDAHRLVLDVLTETDAVELLTRILGEERVAAEPDDAVELARLCGYLPLALRIAAAQLVGDRGRSIAAQVAKLRSPDRLGRLAIGHDQDASVRATFDSSYQVIDVRSARLFRMLGCSPGPDFDVAAASALVDASPSTAEQLLNRLASAHLIESSGPGRYTLHDLLRLYAVERSRTDDLQQERDSALRRLFDMYLHTADVAVTQMFPTAEPVLPNIAGSGESATPIAGSAAAKQWLDSERPNLVAAIRHAAVNNPRDLTWRLSAVLAPYFYSGMHRSEWLEACELGLCVARQDHDQIAESVVLHSLHRAHYAFGDYEKALDFGLRSLDNFPQENNPSGEAELCKQFGHTYWVLGRPAESFANFMRARDLYHQIGNRFSEAQSMNGMSLSYLDRGMLEEVLAQTSQALVIHRELGARVLEGGALHIRAQALAELRKLDESLDAANQAMEIYRETGFRYNWASVTTVAASAHREAGRYESALADGYRALSWATEMHDPRGISLAHSTLALTHLAIDQREEASSHIESALAVATESGYRRAYVDALIGLARINLARQEYGESIENARTALRIARACDFQGCVNAAAAALHTARRSGSPMARDDEASEIKNLRSTTSRRRNC